MPLETRAAVAHWFGFIALYLALATGEASCGVLVSMMIHHGWSGTRVEWDCAMGGG
jgi:hypothetical protein